MVAIVKVGILPARCVVVNTGVLPFFQPCIAPATQTTMAAIEGAEAMPKSGPYASTLPAGGDDGDDAGGGDDEVVRATNKRLLSLCVLPLKGNVTSCICSWPPPPS